MYLTQTRLLCVFARCNLSSFGCLSLYLPCMPCNHRRCCGILQHDFCTQNKGMIVVPFQSCTASNCSISCRSSRSLFSLSPSICDIVTALLIELHKGFNCRIKRKVAVFWHSVHSGILNSIPQCSYERYSLTDAVLQHTHFFFSDDVTISIILHHLFMRTEVHHLQLA